MHGIISAYVDDFCWGSCELFKKSVIDKQKAIFVVKPEDSANFWYYGLDVNQQKNIVISQDKYV